MNDKKNNASLKDSFLYYCDLWLSKGTFSTIILLFIVTGIIILLISVLARIFGGTGDSFGSLVWNTMNHTFDPGVLSGDTGSKVFLFLMLLATLAGVFFLALLIGLINDGIQSRVADLSKGIEAVVENNHVIILGFNESTFIILGELVEAYRNRKKTRNVVVVMDQFPKNEMEDRIRIELPDTGNLHIVCRSGSISNSKDLHRCAIENCKSVIIAALDDFETIKSILACTRELNLTNDSDAFITSVIYRYENEHAARIAGDDSEEDPYLFSVKNDRLELLMLENTISKIMTHTCRQKGLSNVFVDLFNFAGHEFYISRRSQNTKLYEQFDGKTIREINRCLSNAIAVGIITRNGESIIGDPNTVRLEEGSQLILLKEDDGIISPEAPQKISFTPSELQFHAKPSSVLIIGCNEKLPKILHEMCQYLTSGTTIYLASDKEELDKWLAEDTILELLANNIDSAFRIERKDMFKPEDSYRKTVSESIDNHQYIYDLLAECKPNFVLSLSSDTLDDNKADEEALKVLLYCKHYKENHPDAKFGITCEMRSIANQQLAQDTMASDFVISHNIASLMMSQIAENRELRGVFETLLNSEGYEVYMKPAKYYISTAAGEIDYYSLQEAVAEKGEIFIGLKKKSPDGEMLIMNPEKGTGANKVSVSFTEEDEIVVLAENIEIMNSSAREASNASVH